MAGVRCAESMIRNFTFRAMLAALALGAAPAVIAAPPIEEKIETLRPGGFVWQPEVRAHGPVEIVISLADQRAFVYRGGELIGASTISSGRQGYESPIGRFQILAKKRVHRSNRYDDAPMPFMQRLNWYGVALHAGEIPGRPASHGCIRLPLGFARALFGATETGGFVFVTEDRLATPEAALKLARSNANAPFGPGRTFESGPGGGAREAR